MKCRSCGYESAEQFAFCPCCGNAVTDTTEQLCVEREEPSGNPAANRILGILKDKLFLIICILVTAGTVGGMISDNFNVIHILATVFLWLLYAQVQKGTLDSTQLKNISGTVYASYVVTNVACIILIVCGLICGVTLGAFGDEIINEIAEMAEIADYESYELALSVSAAVLGVIIVIVFIVIAALALLINIFGVRNIHRFVKSVYQSVERGELKPVKCRTAHNWLMIFGVIGALSALGSLVDLDIFGFIASGGIAGAEILAAMLINKNLSDCE